MELEQKKLPGMFLTFVTQPACSVTKIVSNFVKFLNKYSLMINMLFLELLWRYRRGLFGGSTGRGGRGGLSGRPASLSPSGGVSALKHRPEVLLPVEVFLRWVRSDRLEEQECSVL